MSEQTISEEEVKNAAKAVLSTPPPPTTKRSIVRSVVIPFTTPAQREREYQFQVLRFDPRALLAITKPGDHTLIVGQSGSGKTTAWMTLLFLFRSVARKRQRKGGKGEMVIINDSKFEPLLLSKYFKLKYFVPRGGFIDWDSVAQDPDVNSDAIEKAFFDPNNIEGTLFPQFSKSKINVLTYEHFHHEPEERVRFWGGDRSKGTLGFFASLLEQKSRGLMDCDIRIFFDEFETICAGQKAGTFTGQTKLSNWIYQALGGYRSAHIGFVASCWGINFLHKGITNQFQYYILKRVKTPDALGPYERLFNGCKDAPEDICTFVTKNGKYDTKMGVDQIIDPKEIFIQHYLTLEADQESKCKHKEFLAKTWQWLLANRTHLVRANVSGVGLKQKELARALGVADTSITEMVQDIFPKDENDTSMAGVADRIIAAQQPTNGDDEEAGDSNPLDRRVSEEDIVNADAKEPDEENEITDDEEGDAE